MKTGLRLLVLIVIWVGSVSAKPVLESRPDSFDFGRVGISGTLVQNFWLVSTGDEPIEIGDIKTGCSCVSALIADSGRPGHLEPGDSIQVRVEWQTRADSGFIARTILVTAKQLITPVHIELSALVGKPDDQEPVVAGPAKLELPHGDRSRRQSGRARLINRSDTDLGVTRVGAEIVEFDTTVPDSVGAESTGTLTVALSKEYEVNEFEQSVTLEFARPTGPPYRLTIPVGKGDFSFRPSSSTHR